MRLSVASFAILIAIGAVLLSLPISTVDGSQLAAVDAFFVSTSAVCVTGLSPIDVSRKLSVFGQVVILCLMQIGGLGFMVIATTFLSLLNRRLAIAEKLAVQHAFHHSPTQQIKRLIFYIVTTTLLIEIVGAAILIVHWLATKRFETVGQTVYFAVFHSVAAFTNSGFSLFSDSLVGFQKDFLTLIVISLLILFGGLGFLVTLEFFDFLGHYFKTLLVSGGNRRTKAKNLRRQLSVQTKLTVSTNVLLVVLGTVLIFLFERSTSMAHLSTAEAWLNAYVGSVIPRTAGFNNLDMLSLSGATIWLMILLMFVGASPGSTGGGIKTSTFGLLAVYAVSRLRGSKRLNLFNRTIPQESVDKAAAVVVLATALIVTVTLILMITETYVFETGNKLSTGADKPPFNESWLRFFPLLFETVSAFGTVGLSLNQTDKLSFAGKLIITGMMFVGRVGALGLALAISTREAKSAEFSYAEENIMVG